MALKSGSYEVKTSKQVVVWPAPDHNGDGEPVTKPEYDENGMHLGDNFVKDEHDREVRYYLPPEGFANKPGYDHTDNWVMVNDRGAIKRLANGEAINIRPGEALVFEPDGTLTRVRGEYAQRLWEQAHKESSEE